MALVSRWLSARLERWDAPALADGVAPRSAWAPGDFQLPGSGQQDPEALQRGRLRSLNRSEEGWMEAEPGRSGGAAASAVSVALSRQPAPNSSRAFAAGLLGLDGEAAGSGLDDLQVRAVAFTERVLSHLRELSFFEDVTQRAQVVVVADRKVIDAGELVHRNA